MAVVVPAAGCASVVVATVVAVVVLDSLVSVMIEVDASFAVVVLVVDGASVLGLLIELEHWPARIEPTPGVHVPSGHGVQACKPKASPYLPAVQ